MNRTEILIREIQKWVKQGYIVANQTEYTASLYRFTMSLGKKLMGAGTVMSTFGAQGLNVQPDGQESVYIVVNEKGKVTVTKGKASI